ncbi:MAG: hypothetical protein ACUVXA_04805 [Candidatus Jordarchaeum sp.]|uniref:hypothetical protein n=1 Tax=Candidatus Jordarchaeum sp. TaxID=2823881 RepID=UPI004049182F
MAEIAVVTSNMRLYYKVVQELKNEGIYFISIKPGEAIPKEIKCVITSSSEEKLTLHPNILIVDDEDSNPIVPRLRYVLTESEPSLIIVGVDPGKTYGIAVLINKKVLETHKSFSSKEAAEIIKNILKTFPAVRRIIRIGTGNPLYYKQLLELLKEVDADLELVNEFETSRGSRATKDTKAAIAIANKKGLKPQEFEKLQMIKKGVIKNIQKMSRQASQGKITIDESNALRVAKGEISLDLAIESQKKKTTRKNS